MKSLLRFAVVLATLPCVRAQSVSLVSVAPNQAPSNGHSQSPSISADGRYVVFTSFATNLVANNDSNGRSDVFLHDRNTGSTVLISASPSGSAGNHDSGSWSQSPPVADGRYVVFVSFASDLVANDTNGKWDVFLRDVTSGVTECISVNSAGVQALKNSDEPYVSADGRYVTFISSAGNLVPGDTNGNSGYDVFLRDRQAGTTTRLSVNANGVEADLPSSTPCLSPDGRFVAFASLANNLVPDDTNGDWDQFLFDRQTNSLERVSVSSNGGEGDGASGFWDPGSGVSADGRWIAFTSRTTNLVPQDTNGLPDVLLRDRVLGTTTRVSVGSSGQPSNGDSHFQWISADGRWIAFHSLATNLIANDTNGQADVFVHDRLLGTTELASSNSSGGLGNGETVAAALSADGRFIAFDSWSSDLVAGDTNTFPDAFVRDRCGSVVSYCTAGQTSNGCFATMSASGTPSVSAGSGFTLAANDVEGQKTGLLFYGVSGPKASPWAPGSTSYACVKSPVQRLSSQDSGGTAGACDGTIADDLLAYFASHPTALGQPLNAGTLCNAQCWFRDPPAPGTTNLSNGIQWIFCP